MAEGERPAFRAQLVYLRKQIGARLAELDEDVSFWRPRAFAGHIIIAGLGALITVMAGLKSGGGPFLKWVWPVLLVRENWILILGATITLGSAWQAFYNHRDRWLNYAASAERLRALLTKVDYEAEGNGSEEKVQKLFDEFVRYTHLTQSGLQLRKPRL